MAVQQRAIVVPVTGGTGDERVLDILGRLLQQTSTNITLVYVLEVVQSISLDAELPDAVNRGEVVLAQAERYARGEIGKNIRLSNVTTEILQARAAGAAIVDEAFERHADAIVMSSAVRTIHGRSTIGETADYVLKNAPCEVILVREPLGYPARSLRSADAR